MVKKKGLHINKTGETNFSDFFFQADARDLLEYDNAMI